MVYCHGSHGSCCLFQPSHTSALYHAHMALDMSKTHAIFSPGMVFNHFILLWVQEMCCLFCSNNKQSEMGFTHIHCVRSLRLHNTKFCPCLMSSLLHSSYCIICSTSPISLIKEYSWISVLIASV